MNKIHIKNASKFFLGNLTKSFVYSGKNTKAKIIPVIIDKSIGFRSKNDNTINTAKTRVEVMFLQKDFSIVSPIFYRTKRS